MRFSDPMSANRLWTASSSVVCEVFTPWSESAVFSRRRVRALMDGITSAAVADDELICCVSSLNEARRGVIFSINFHWLLVNEHGNS